jgi:SAM-dependent methyltransferase
MPKLYDYFDKAYFQDGATKGTAYVNYRDSARKSPTFRELAATVREIFQPRRVLEIGCATGIVVKHLNNLGCEAHGIDVSEWAVKNAEHPNVRLASADSLPWPDAHFDLVLSCHSLEHLPDGIFDRAISELIRVCSGFQFHMLPIVGLPPYDGDPESVKQNLRKDPTHQQLRDYDWWTRQFRNQGCSIVETSIPLEYDTEQVELTTCQFVLKTPGVDDTPVLRRAAARNRMLFRKLQLAGSEGSLRRKIGVDCMGGLNFVGPTWKDVEARLEPPVDMSGTVFNLALFLNGKPAVLRFAAGSKDYSSVAEYYFKAEPGFNFFRFTADQLRVLRGTPDLKRVARVALGGENESSDIVFFFCDQLGGPVVPA